MMCTESLLGILMSRAQADVQRDYSSKQQMRERATQTTTNRQLRRNVVPSSVEMAVVVVVGLLL